MRDIDTILKQYKEGKMDLEEAKAALSLFSLEFIEDGVKLDLGRYSRRGIPEVIYAEKKDPEVLINIITRFLVDNSAILLSRVLTKHLDLIKEKFEDQFDIHYAPSFEPFTVTITKFGFKFPTSNCSIGLLTAGTSDIPVAEEARAIARLMGVQTVQFNDVGIAGVHRLFTPLKEMVKEKVRVIVVVAGMEGALPTIVSSLVNVPVIGVPASTGYGYGGKGEGALMTMLQSCSPGLVVVNIDNGINAGATAALIAKQCNNTKR
ncbi:MAG: nickel pincer cofactor biosynthesis protein LarB [Candidatus Heimdallarchaeota archaeon]|nr:MAG: nickel pincer cofactor biosynthesis protein LarB [Candidatus Heimdallarchaeota archaeon]